MSVVPRATWYSEGAGSVDSLVTEVCSDVENGKDNRATNSGHTPANDTSAPVSPLSFLRLSPVSGHLYPPISQL